VDIDDLKKDPSLKDFTRLRDVIMCLYLRTIHSERKVNELWDSIEFLKRQTAIQFLCGAGLGSLITLFVLVLL
jgi:hypothetical protein